MLINCRWQAMTMSIATPRRPSSPSNRAAPLGPENGFMTWPLAARLGAELAGGGDNLHLSWLLAWVAHAAAHARNVLDANSVPAGVVGRAGAPGGKRLEESVRYFTASIPSRLTRRVNAAAAS